MNNLFVNHDFDCDQEETEGNIKLNECIIDSSGNMELLDESISIVEIETIEDNSELELEQRYQSVNTCIMNSSSNIEIMEENENLVEIEVIESSPEIELEQKYQSLSGCLIDSRSDIEIFEENESIVEIETSSETELEQDYQSVNGCLIDSRNNIEILEENENLVEIEMIAANSEIKLELKCEPTDEYIIEPFSDIELVQQSEGIVQNEVRTANSKVELNYETLLATKKSNYNEDIEVQNLTKNPFSNEVNVQFLESDTISSEVQIGSDVVVSILNEDQGIVQIYTESVHKLNDEFSCSNNHLGSIAGSSDVIISSSVPIENSSVSVVNECVLQTKDVDSTAFMPTENELHPSQLMVLEETGHISNTVDIFNKTDTSMNDSEIDLIAKYGVPAFQVEVDSADFCRVNTFAPSLSILNEMELSQKCLDEMAVRRSSRIRSIAEKKKQKKSDTDKSFIKLSDCQECDPNSENVSNFDSQKNSRCKSGPDSKCKDEYDKELRKKSLPKSSKRVNKKYNRPLNSSKKQNKVASKPEKYAPVNIVNPVRKYGDNDENNYRICPQIECSNRLGVLLAHKKVPSRAKQKPRRRNRRAQIKASNKPNGPSLTLQKSEEFSNSNGNDLIIPSCENRLESLELNKIQTVSKDVQNITISSDCFLDSKSVVKKTTEDHTILKPEKVKSRWRRNSELEHGELNGSSTIINPEPFDSKTLGISRFKEILCPISEELVVQNEQQKHSLQDTKDEVKDLPYFETIDGNIYLFERKRSKTKKEVRRMLCDCSLTNEEQDRGIVGCEDDCLNRLLMIECGSRCATGEACSNRRFQKKKYIPTEPFKTEKKGWGLRVLEDVDGGCFIMEYVGEVLSHVEFRQRVKHYAREKCSHYFFMALKSDEIIDATNKGNCSRFINHSCNPNCETQKWTVNGELRIGFFTKQPVKAGEELTFDYQFQRYGREAQKCHCESYNCHGYIGEAKQISLDHFSTNKAVANKRKKSTEDKKRTVLEDLTFEDEVKRLCENDGLRNREETLILARFMVHAEDVHIRQQLLDLILKTNEVTCLRLFLDYHGLSLLWSWMVDVVDLKLKSKILKVLSILPIPNKTMLLDSKVFNVVTKWASDQPSQNVILAKHIDASESLHSSEFLPSRNEDQFEQVPKKIKLSDTSDSETDGTTYLHHEQDDPIRNLDTEDASIDVVSINNGSIVCNSITDSLPSLSQSLHDEASQTIGVVSDISVLPKSDEESGDAMEDDDDDDKKYDIDLTVLASSLLDSWCGLKEVFRIPRLEQQKRRADELEADRHDEESGKYWKISTIENSNRDYNEIFSRDHIEMEKKHREKGKDYESYQEKVMVVVTESRDKKVYKKSTFCNAEDNLLRPRKVLLPTPPRMSKEERRHLFAMEVQQRDHEEALRKQQEETSVIDQYSSEETYAYSLSTYSQYYYGTSSFTNAYDANATYHKISPGPVVALSPMPAIVSPQPFPLATESSSSLQQSVRSALLPTPNYTESLAVNNTATQYPDMSGSVMYSHPRLIFQQPTTQIPYLGAPPPTLSQPPPNSLLPSHTTSLPRVTQLQSSSAFSNVSGINNVPAKVSHSIPISENSVSNAIIHSSATAAIGPLQTNSCFPGQSNVSATPGYLQNPTQLMSNQNNSVYYAPQSNSSVVSLAEHIGIHQSSIPIPSGISHDELSSPHAITFKLPANWKTATDPDGNIYYYHAITRQTQWDPPASHLILDEDAGTPTFDEPKQSKKRSTTQAAADTSFATEVAKRLKEIFRTKMSSFVVQCLNPYRKPDCVIGRITSTEDFKHLARKLTHFVMAKELRHCKNVEELECNENTKHKAKDFIQKYMLKYGNVYRKEKLSPTND